MTRADGGHRRWAAYVRLTAVVAAAITGAGACSTGPSGESTVVGTVATTVPVAPSSTSPAPTSTTVAATSTTVPFPLTGACPAEATAVVADGPVEVATIAPLSGPASESAAVARGLQTYLAVRNLDGGVAGRMVTVDVLDDGGDPARAAEHATAVAGSGAVALVGTVGRSANELIRTVASTACLPQLFAASGDPSFSDPAAAPWTVGGPVTFAGEGAALARVVIERYPEGAKVAVLRLDNAAGSAYRQAFDAVLAGSPSSVVTEQVIAMDATSTAAEVGELAAAGADVLVNLTSSLFCPRALADLQATGWRPVLVLQTSMCSSVDLLRPVGAAADGVVVARIFKDPADPRWAEDPDMRGHVEALEVVAPGLRAAPLTVLGWTIGELLAAAMEVASADQRGLSRATLMSAGWGAGPVATTLTLPGVALQLEPGRGLLATAVELSTYRADAQAFEPVAPLVPTG
jgi:branched-chain amino acid transport system substrate-binding protein